jgi:Phage-related minor tail protein
MAIVFPISYKVDSSALKNAETQVGSFTGGIKGMIAPLAAVAAGMAAAFGVGKFIEGSIKSFEDLAGSVRPLQRVIGGTTEEVSGLSAAMKLSGMDATAAGTTLKIFSTKLVAASNDGKKASDMVAKLGGDFRDAHGNIKPMSEILPQVADKFASMPNGIEKTALATQLFGRSGLAMLPFLNKGSEGIGELTTKAKEMGLVLDDASMKSFVEAKKAQREFDATMQGLSVTIGSALLPVVEVFQNFVRDALTPAILKVTGFVRNHRAEFVALGEAIKSTVQPVVEALSAFLVGTLIPAIKDMAGWVQQNATMLGALAAVVAGAVAAYMGFQAVTAVITAVKLAQEGYAIATYGAAAADYAAQGVAKIGAVIYAIQNSAIVAGTAAWIANTAAAIANAEGGTLAKIAIVASSVATGIATAAQWAWNAAMSANPIGIVVVAVGALIAGIIYLATQTTFFQDVWKAMVTGVTAGWKAFTGFVNTSLHTMGDFFGTVFGAIGDGIKGYINGWLGMFGSFVNFVVGGLNSVIGLANQALSAIASATGGAVNLKVPTVPTVKIPKLANGGIVNPTLGGSLVNVAEAGKPEAIIPLNRNGSMPGSGATINVTVNAGLGSNGANIAQEIVKTLKTYERANGAIWVAA